MGKTYQITVNEKEADILQEHIKPMIHEIDYALVDGTFRRGQDTERAIEHLDALKKVSQQLPNKE